MYEENNLNGLKILRQAKKHNGQFILDELDETLTKMVSAIRNSPSKGGSLNINIALSPSSTDGQIITAMVEIKNIKIPTIDTRPIFAFTNVDGKMSSKDPTQIDMFENTKEINKETGEITAISQNTNITKLK